MMRAKAGSTRWLRRYGGGIASSVLLTVAVAGCTSVRSDLGTSDSSCFLALPTATKAVNAQGHMVGVHRYTLGTLRKKSPGLYGQLATKDHPSQVVCVVAFKGQFSSTAVAEPRGRSSGKLAVVVTTSPGNHLLATVIFKQLPLRFAHSHIG